MNNPKYIILDRDGVINLDSPNYIKSADEWNPISKSLDEIKKLLSNKGETEINLVVKDKNNQAIYLLQENRKFDLNHLKALKAKKYVEKITV